MAIKKRKFVCEKDFDLINKFLSDINIMNPNTDNWDNARWSFNRFCIHNAEESTGNRVWENGVQIWEDDDEIIGVCHYEEPGDYFLQVHPQYKVMEDEMLVYAMENCKAQFPKLNSLSLSSTDGDKKRESLLEKHGALNRILLMTIDD